VNVGFTSSDTNYNNANGSGSITIEKASSTTVVSCPASVIFNGAAQTPCSATVTGAGGLSLTPTPTYTNNINAGTATASASFAGDANHNDSSDSKNFTIEKAASVTTVTCGAGPFTYSGNPHTPCSASVTGPGLNESLTVNYTGNVNAGTATASASYAESANYLGSNDSKNFTIEKAASVTTMTCPASVTYNGAAQTPCTAAVTGVGGLTRLSRRPTQTTSTRVRQPPARVCRRCNHNDIATRRTSPSKAATPVTTVTRPASVIYTGSPLTPCTVS
jgi:hypothetical protein